MSNGKRFTLQEAVALTCDDEAILYYPLTEREAFMLLGQIEFIGWQTRWKEKSFTQDYLDEKVASIADGLMNPQEGGMSCEQVEDCLETSGTVNAINELTLNMTQYNQRIENQNRLDRWQEAEDITDINEDAPPMFSSNAQQDINEMCVAVSHFVRDFQARMKDASLSVIGGSAVVISSGTFLAGVSAFFNPLVSLIGGAIVYLGLLTLTEAEDVLEAYSDETAIEDIVCELLQELHHRNTTYANYISAIETVNSNQSGDDAKDIIMYWLDLYCKNEAIFAYFVDILGTVQDGDFEDCECIVPEGCGGSLVVFPDPALPTSYTLPSYLTFGPGTNIIDYSGVEFWIFMLSEEWFEIEMPLSCITGMNFGGIFRQASGSGIPDLTISIDGVDVHSVSLNVGGGTVSHYPTWTGVVGRTIRVRNNSIGGASNRNFQVRLVSVDTNND